MNLLFLLTGGSLIWVGLWVYSGIESIDKAIGLFFILFGSGLVYYGI